MTGGHLPVRKLRASEGMKRQQLVLSFTIALMLMEETGRGIKSPLEATRSTRRHSRSPRRSITYIVSRQQGEGSVMVGVKGHNSLYCSCQSYLGKAGAEFILLIFPNKALCWLGTCPHTRPSRPTQQLFTCTQTQDGRHSSLKRNSLVFQRGHKVWLFPNWSSTVATFRAGWAEVCKHVNT